ncbi:MAG TPA: DUF3179 domain-containing protein [Nitriliruptoraceae bacterium]|nr:DUF3179 domain-containing protein [Nitriliruptoraceae bacterium]
MASTSRFVIVGGALALVLGACTATNDAGDQVTAVSDSAGSDATTDDASPPPQADRVRGDGADGGSQTCIPLEEFANGDVVPAPTETIDFPWDRADPVVLEGFDFDDIVSGGPPPDGIQPIDDPCFDAIAAADEWLQPQSPVMVVEVDGDRRAYPLAIMTQHEIVNDVVGGVPLVVTYCPLCNSGLAFERTVDGRVFSFGTSGRLFQSNLVMYDRQTRTLWTQFTGQAVVGADLVGTELTRVPTGLLGWEDFKSAAPDGVVLSRGSMPNRDYGRNPYPGYEGSGDQFLFRGPRDDRLGPNTRVVGLGTDVDPLAVGLPHLRDQQVMAVQVDGQPVTVWWAPGQASALDAASVDDGLDVGSTAAFVAQLDDATPLSFVADQDQPGHFVDDQTGSTWNLLGEAVDGDLAGTQLEAVAHDDTFWFVWFAFQPDTRILASGVGDG